MSRIFSSVKEDSLRKSIERVASAIQSEIDSKAFYNLEKDTLKTVFEKSANFIKFHTFQESKSKSSFSEKTLDNSNKSSFLRR